VNGIDNPKDEPPKKIGHAVRLLYATLAIGVVRGVMEGSANSAAAGLVFTMFIAVAVLGFMGWLIFMIGRRRNWARITFLVLFLLGSPAILLLVRSFAANPVSGFLGFAQVVLQAAALVFLFQPESSAWFRGANRTAGPG
jgi:hypothetical protein